MRLLSLCISLAFVVSCAGQKPNRDPTGEAFPTVQGTTLAKKPTMIPDEIAKPAVVLLGYTQDAQFDIDRWILGLSQLGLKLPIYEVPTIDGLIPGLIANKIDNGMRSGIPREDWTAVITVYGDADRITSWTGTESPNNARVLLLDQDGRATWFHDRGYSAGRVQALFEAANTATATAAVAQ